MTHVYERKQSSDLFHDLKKMDRNNFSYNGANALMDYMIELAEGTGEPIEYDPIAYCCEFTEYPDIESFQEQNGKEYETMSDIRDITQVIEFDGGFIVSSF